MARINSNFNIARVFSFFSIHDFSILYGRNFFDAMVNTILDKYHLLGIIGEGGMATVYKAQHTAMKHHVAIKLLNPALTSQSSVVQRFKNEAQMMASLNHPNITRVVDLIEEGHKLGIVMELLEGEDLKAYITRKQSLNQKEITSVFSQCLAALQYAHDQGIVHRDIKPSNIYVLPDGLIKILDFGVAKIFGTGQDATQTGTQIGTPVYMSPEQVKGDKSIDFRSDIYSLGVTMFYAVNGTPPYDSSTTSQFDILNKIVHEDLPKFKKKSPFEPLILKACQKDREQRYQGCNEWQNALQGVGLSPVKKARKKQEKSKAQVLEGTAKKVQEILPQSIKQNRKRKLGAIVMGGLIIAFGAFFLIQTSGSSNCVEGDCENGEGTYLYPNEDQYEGSWANGTKHGQGMYTWANGDFYNGPWEYDAKHGDEAFFQRANLTFDGSYYYGLMDRGTIVIDDELTIRRGSWDYNTEKDFISGTGRISDGMGSSSEYCVDITWNGNREAYEVDVECTNPELWYDKEGRIQFTSTEDPLYECETMSRQNYKGNIIWKYSRKRRGRSIKEYTMESEIKNGKEFITLSIGRNKKVFEVTILTDGFEINYPVTVGGRKRNQRYYRSNYACQ